jgi:hypothetical protein
MFWVVSKPKTTVDLGSDLGLLEALESFGILSLDGPKFVNGGAEFLEGPVVFEVVEIGQRLLVVETVELLAESDDVGIVVILVFVARAGGEGWFEKVAAEVLADTMNVTFLGGHGTRVERSHGAGAGQADGIVVAIFLVGSSFVKLAVVQVATSSHGTSAVFVRVLGTSIGGWDSGCGLGTDASFWVLVLEALDHPVQGDIQELQAA